MTTKVDQAISDIMKLHPHVQLWMLVKFARRMKTFRKEGEAIVIRAVHRYLGLD